MKKWFLTVFLVMTAFLLNAQYSPITINRSGTVVNTNESIIFSNNIILSSGNLYITNHAYDASTSQLDPQANEYVTAGFVRSVLNNGAFLYGTPNTTSVGFTNYDGTTNTIALQFGVISPTNYIKQFSNFVAGTYWASVISTNTFQSASGPYVNDLYVNLDADKANPNPGPTFTMMPDIYATYDRTNLILLAGGAAQSIVYHATNLYTWIQSSPQYTSTNSAGFYIVRRVKCNSFTVGGGNANPIINVFGGSNYITSVAFNTPVTVNANYSGTFTGNGAGLTNIYSTNIVTQAGTLAVASDATNYTVNLLPGGMANLQQIYLANTNCYITFTGTNVIDSQRAVLFRGWTNTVVSTLTFALPTWRTNYTTANYFVTNGQSAVFNFYNTDTTGSNVMVSDGGRWK
jgi:hypothetical protein